MPATVASTEHNPNVANYHRDVEEPPSHAEVTNTPY